MRGWTDPEGLTEKDEFPMIRTSDPLLWASFTVLPLGNQPQGQISIFCGLGFGQLALTFYIIQWMTGILSARWLLVLIVPDLSSTQLCWPQPFFQNIGFLAWLSPGFLPPPWVLYLWLFCTVSPLLDKLNPSLSLLLILCFPTEYPIHTHARP